MEKGVEHVVWDRNEDVTVSENLCYQERLKKLRPYSERKGLSYLLSDQRKGTVFMHFYQPGRIN